MENTNDKTAVKMPEPEYPGPHIFTRDKAWNMAQLKAYGDARAEEARREAADEIGAMFGIGSAVRDMGTIRANYDNLRRRADCLSAVEREFFMEPGEPDADFPGVEPDDECMLNWGADPARYVTDFRAALAKIATQRTAGGDAVCDNCDGAGGWKTAEWVDPVSGPECEGVRCEVCEGTGKAPVAEAAVQADTENEVRERLARVFDADPHESLRGSQAAARIRAGKDCAAPTAQPTTDVQPVTRVDRFGNETRTWAAQPTPPDDELIRGFDRSLASMDSHDPQSFIDGAKWAEQNIRAALRQPGAKP